MHFIRICGLSLLSEQWVCGQTATPAKPEVAGRRAWVVATTMPEDAPNPLPVMADDKLHMVRMHLRAVGQAIPIDETGVVRAVKPAGMESINPLEQEKHGVFPVRFFYEVPTQPNGEWKLMTSSKMAVYKSRREICIFYYNEEIENVDFRGIPFITPPSRSQPRQP